jgi:hypothetical protein
MYNLEISIEDKQTGYSRLIRFTTEESINTIQSLLYRMGWTMESNIPPLQAEQSEAL